MEMFAALAAFLAPFTETLVVYLPVFVVDNWMTLGVVATALVVAFGAVARMTKNTVDDKVAGVAARVVDVLTKLPVRRKT